MPLKQSKENLQLQLKRTSIRDLRFIAEGNESTSIRATDRDSMRA